MQNGEIKNGIIYCRVSSLEQVDGTSLESQERLCRDYAAREGIILLAVFIERGESAKTADRTEFMKAIAFCADRKNKVKFFVVYKIDRFSRNQTDYAITKQKLKNYGTDIQSVSEKIDDTPSGKLMEVMLSGFAEFDNNVRTERSVNGMKERLKQGVWVWQAPLGYHRTSQGANLSPDPKYASYIKLAFEEYSKGIHTFESLSQFLNDRGFVTRNGYSAFPQLLERMIKNPIYCGIIRVWDIEKKGSFEPLIDEHLFHLCQNAGRRGNKSGPRLAKNPNFPLRKLAICQFCLEPLTGSFSRGRKGIRYPYYHHHKQDCDHAESISKKRFEGLFVEYLKEINPTLQYESAFKEVVADIWNDKFQKVKEQNEQIRKEIRELELRRQRIFELFESGTYLREEFMAQKDSVNRKIAQKQVLINGTETEGINMNEAL